MPEFSVNATRFDPYKTFRFRIKWDGKYVAGVSKVSGLTRTTEVVKHREGGSPGIAYRAPGQTEYAAITLERGVTHDVDFENWANLIWSKPNATSTFDKSTGTEVSLKNFRKDIIIELYNEADQKVLAYNVFRCWVSEYTALPDLDANSGNTVAIQKIKLENEGWVRDTAVAEPTEYQASTA
jgi:phage tail-like protein